MPDGVKNNHHLDPQRWGKESSSPNSINDKRVIISSSKSLSKPPSNSSLTGSNREKAKVWVREEAVQFLIRYQLDAPYTHPALTVLSRSTTAFQCLQSNELE